VNWKRLRAPFCPYFLRSFILESRVKNPFFPQRRPQLRIESRNRPRQSHAHRSRLSAHSAAMRRHHHVYLVGDIRELQRLDRIMLPRVIRKILLDRAAVHRELSRPRTQEHARHRFLAPPPFPKTKFACPQWAYQ